MERSVYVHGLEISKCGTFCLCEWFRNLRSMEHSVYVHGLEICEVWKAYTVHFLTLSVLCVYKWSPSNRWTVRWGHCTTPSVERSAQFSWRSG